MHMKILVLIMTFSLFAMAQNFELKANNTGSNLEINVIDNAKKVNVFNFQLKHILTEGINIKHKSFSYNGEEYVINIFANQNYLEKNNLNPELKKCNSRGYEEIMYNILSEISYSISLGIIEQGFLKNLNVLEGIENIRFNKRVNFKCQH